VFEQGLAVGVRELVGLEVADPAAKIPAIDGLLDVKRSHDD
jgi:hypothetical protein